MSGFRHDVAGGDGTLIADSIHSPNFQASPLTGWSIDKNGHAYFEAVTIGGGVVRVTFAATAPSSPNTGDVWFNLSAGAQPNTWSGSAWTAYQWGTSSIAAGAITAARLAAGIIVAGIVNGTTITGANIVADGTSGQFLVYSGTPANGNLTASVSGAAGTDGFGNSYPAGIVAGEAAFPQVHLEPGTGGQAEVSFTLPGTWTNYPNIYAQLASPAGAFLSVNGPTDTTVNDQAYMSLSSAASTGIGASVGELSYVDANGTNHIVAGWSKDGFDIRAGSIAATEPGTGTSPTNPYVGETWHTAALLTGWSNISGYAALQYRLLADGNVQISGAAGFSSSFTANTKITTLPAGYRPASKHVVSLHDPLGAVARVEFNTDGTLWAIANGTYPAQNAEIDCVCSLL